MAALITLTSGKRIPVTAGEAENVTDILMRDEQPAIIKIKSIADIWWHVRPQDIASVTS